MYKFRNIHTDEPVAMKFFGYAGVNGIPRQKSIEEEILIDHSMNCMKCTSRLLGYIPDSYDGYVKNVKRTNAKHTPKYIYGKKVRGRHLIKVSEYHDGDDLMNTLLKGAEFDEQTAAIVFKNMAICVKELQMVNILHRDIKCENFIFKHRLETNCSSPSSSSPSSSSLKYELSLIDFGAAKVLENDLHCHIDCTDLKVARHNLLFHAPEVRDALKYSKASDIFSLGVCLWVLLFRAFPTFRETGELREEFPPKFECSNEIKDLFRLMFESDPSKRLDIDGVLKHDFVTMHRRTTDTSPPQAFAPTSFTGKSICGSNITSLSPPNVPISGHSPLKRTALEDICKC